MLINHNPYHFNISVQLLLFRGSACEVDSSVANFSKFGFQADNQRHLTQSDNCNNESSPFPRLVTLNIWTLSALDFDIVSANMIPASASAVTIMLDILIIK